MVFDESERMIPKYKLLIILMLVDFFLPAELLDALEQVRKNIIHNQVIARSFNQKEGCFFPSSNASKAQGKWSSPC